MKNIKEFYKDIEKEVESLNLSAVQIHLLVGMCASIASVPDAKDMDIKALTVSAVSSIMRCRELAEVFIDLGDFRVAGTKSVTGRTVIDETCASLMSMLSPDEDDDSPEASAFTITNVNLD